MEERKGEKKTFLFVWKEDGGTGACALTSEDHLLTTTGIYSS